MGDARGSSVSRTCALPMMHARESLRHCLLKKVSDESAGLSPKFERAPGAVRRFERWYEPREEWHETYSAEAMTAATSKRVCASSRHSAARREASTRNKKQRPCAFVVDAEEAVKTEKLAEAPHRAVFLFLSLFLSEQRPTHAVTKLHTPVARLSCKTRAESLARETRARCHLALFLSLLLE